MSGLVTWAGFALSHPSGDLIVAILSAEPGPDERVSLRFTIVPDACPDHLIRAVTRSGAIVTGADPFAHTDLLMRLREAGLNVLAVRQGFVTLSSPSRTLTELVARPDGLTGPAAQVSVLRGMVRAALWRRDADGRAIPDRAPALLKAVLNALAAREAVTAKQASVAAEIVKPAPLQRLRVERPRLLHLIQFLAGVRREIVLNVREDGGAVLCGQASNQGLDQADQGQGRDVGRGSGVVAVEHSNLSVVLQSGDDAESGAAAMVAPGEASPGSCNGGQS